MVKGWLLWLSQSEVVEEKLRKKEKEIVTALLLFFVVGNAEQKECVWLLFPSLLDVSYWKLF